MTNWPTWLIALVSAEIGAAVGAGVMALLIAASREGVGPE